MMGPVIAALFMTIIGGIMNGSFALPAKYIKHWEFENVWLNYVVWAFLILPWLIIYFLDGNIWSIYNATSANSILILIIGGCLFGIGQICFAWALNKIGLGLGFIINIGLGTGLGLLLPLTILHTSNVFSAFGLTTLIALAFIIAGLILSYKAGKMRDAHKPSEQISSSKKQYAIGVILAIFAGVFSAGQNLTFASTNEIQQIALNQGAAELAASTIIWPLFLLFAFVPYAIYMIMLHQKNKSGDVYLRPHLTRNMFLAFIMGAFWYGSLMLYSQASVLIGALGPVIAWPLFMVLIILTSSFWGWKHKEWEGAPKHAKSKALLSIGCLVLAILILAFAATLS
jgi:L-rhamnose-H+ transport protein